MMYWFSSVCCVVIAPESMDLTLRLYFNRSKNLRKVYRCDVCLFNCILLVPLSLRITWSISLNKFTFFNGEGQIWINPARGRKFKKLFKDLNSWPVRNQRNGSRPKHYLKRHNVLISDDGVMNIFHVFPFQTKHCIPIFAFRSSHIQA